MIASFFVCRIEKVSARLYHHGMGDVAEHGGPRRRLIRGPLAPPALALAAGVLAGRYAPLPVGVWFVLGAAGLICTFATLRREHLRALTMTGVCAVIFALGAVRLHTVYFTRPANHISRYAGQVRRLATLRGRIVDQPQFVESYVEFGWSPPPRMSLLLECEALRTPEGWRNVRGPVRVNITEPYAVLGRGDRVELLGWLGRYRPAGNPGEFDAAAAARRSGAEVWCIVPAADGAMVLERAADAPTWRRTLARLRAPMRQRLVEAGDPESGRIVTALLLGERSPGLRRMSETMVRAGIAHFLSISGLHLGVFLSFVYLLGRAIRLSPRRAAGAVLVVLGAYLLLAEPRPALLRSAIMAACLAGATLSERRYSSLNALAAAGVILLLIDPRQLLAPGFQLSFAIVAGLILLSGPMRDLLFAPFLHRRGLIVFRDASRRRRWLYFSAANWAMRIVAMSLTAYLAAAPLAAVHFGLFSPLAAVLSVLLFPLIVAILVPGYLSMALAWPTPNLSALLGDLSAWFADGLAAVVGRLEAIPFLSVPLRPVGAGWAALAYTAIVLAALAPRIRHGWRWAGLAAVALAAVTTASQWPARPGDAAELNLLAVGNGQCAVLQTPEGQTVLLDAGTRSGFDAYRRVLQPFLRARRLPAPAAAFISHANTDHYSALPGAIRNGNCRTVCRCDYFGRRESGSAQKMLDLMQREKVDIRRLRAGDRLTLDERTAVEVLWPPPNRTDLTANDTSLVLRVSCDGKTVLLPGDLSEVGMQELLKTPEKLKADALIIPHHGGWEKQLPAFVQAVAPKIVLVSNSRDPHGPTTAGPKTRDFYKLLHKDYQYYSTARNGWIQLRFASGRLEVETMR